METATISRTAIVKPTSALISGHCIVKVDYDLSCEAALNAATHGGRADKDINDIHFPPSDYGLKEIAIALFSFRVKANSQLVEREMSEIFFRPIRREEVLAYCALYPKSRHNLIALGAIWKPSVPYTISVVDKGGKRVIGLQYALSSFPAGTCFPGVKVGWNNSR